MYLSFAPMELSESNLIVEAINMGLLRSAAADYSTNNLISSLMRAR
jgi:hypothetical protein